MALLTPILGRRTVVQRVTFGIFGKPHSRGWYLTGPLTVVLHIVSNAANAWMVKRTKGFYQVHTGELMLLWLTRPRMAWMIVILVPWQSRDVMYFGVAASSLFAEVVLQIISTFYIGRAVEYARGRSSITVVD
jgi:hypothetical protein